jgi:hypothetical protein
MSEASTEKITVRCSCGAKLRLSAAAAGKRARCPKCQNVFAVPSVSMAKPSAPPAAEKEPRTPPPDEGLAAFEELAEQERTAAAESAPDISCGYNLTTGKQMRAASVTAAKAHKAARLAGNFMLGCVLSAAGALIGAILWAVVLYVTEYEIGWIAWILGVLAGWGMLLGYRERNMRAGVVAALFAVLGIAGARIMIIAFILSSAMGDLTDSPGFRRLVLSFHRVQLQSYEMEIPPWEQDRYGELLEQHGAEVDALNDSAFAEEWQSFERWGGDTKWQDENFVQTFLVHRMARVGLPEEFDDEPPISLVKWEERCRNARDEVEAMTDDERVAQARELKEQHDVPLDAIELESWLKASIGGSAVAMAKEEFEWTELFVSHPLDLLFIALALFSAWRIAAGGHCD